MTEPTPITQDEADEMLWISVGDEVELDDGHTYKLVDEPNEIIDQRRWASIHRKIYSRDDLTNWALDYEQSDIETHEHWSYIEPQLKPVTGVERTVTVWELI